MLNDIDRVRLVALVNSTQVDKSHGLFYREPPRGAGDVEPLRELVHCN